MTVLIINDEVWTADMIREEVDWTACGIQTVKTAYDAAGAKAVIQEESIDILLCDIEMPGENGIELMRWVRQQGYGMECIFLTCHAEFVYAQEAIRLNCQDYILMPARAQEIQEGLRKAVSRIREKKASGQLEKYGAQWVESQKEELHQLQGRKSNEELVRDCESFIHTHLMDSGLSVQTVADFCHLNPVHLNRIFRREKDISVGKYIIRERMTLAARLLEDPSISANLVAERTGYPNYSYFSTSFKKYFGYSPQTYAQLKKHDES